MQTAMPHPVVAHDPAWVGAAGRRVRRYLRCLRCPQDACDDLVQEALLAAVRNFGGAEPPLPWLLTTARNLWQLQCRRRRRSLPAGEWQRLHDRAVHELGADGGDQRLERLRRCLAQLPPRSRLALELRYRDALSRTAIAERLGLREEGVKSLLSRLRNVLQACIARPDATREDDDG